jgi:hypothetical protein
MLLMMRWPGGGTDLFRSIFRAPAEQPLPPSGPTAIPSL